MLHLPFLDHGLKLFLLLFKLIFFLPDDLEVLKLPHELLHRVLLYPNELLQTIDLCILLKDPPLRSIQLFPMLILHFLLEIIYIPLEIVMLSETLFLGYV